MTAQQSPASIGPDLGHCLLGALLAARAGDRPDATFAIFPDRELSYADVDADARRVAKGLIAHGVTPGTHVAIFMPSCADWLSAYFGILYAGGVVVALNARYKKHELAYTVEHSDAQLLLTTDAIADHVDLVAVLSDTFPEIATAADPAELDLPGAPQLKSVVLFGSTTKPGTLSGQALRDSGAAMDDAALAAATRDVDPGDVAVLMYTSGTTSNPKGCELSHAGIGRSWRTFAEVASLSAGETLWMPMPFFHTGGIGPMAAVMWRGAAFVAQPHFEPEEIVGLILKHLVEHLYSGFPQFSLTVLQHPSYTRERFGFIRSMLNVGPPGMQRTIQGLLPEGAKLLNLFGMTEGSGIVTFTPWDTPLEQRAVTSGRAPAHTDVRIVDPDTGLEAAPDVPGEIQFRGGGALVGYYKDAKATADTIIDGGWVRTGDRGKMDADGWIYYLGRLKDMLKVGGENVAAAEVEAVLAQHPAVRLAQVVGIPDERLIEVPAAFIEGDAAAASAEELMLFVRERIAPFKVPRHVRFVTEWPMSASKIQKFRLRQGLLDELGIGEG